MPKRSVYLEKSSLNTDTGSDDWKFYAIGISHYAIRVGDDDWFEVSANDGRKKDTAKIAHTKDRNRPERTGTISLAGATFKTNEEILKFNENWIRDNKEYVLDEKNCQKYALDLAQWLTPGSFKVELPLAQTNSWANKPNAHARSADGLIGFILKLSNAK